MKTGLYENIPDWKYHKGGDGHLSSSQLKYALKNPGLFKAMTMDGLVKYDTAALKFGRASHTFILENDKFEGEYMIFDDSIDMRLKKSKELKKDFEEKAKKLKRTVLPLSDYEKIVSMRHSILEYKPAGDLLSEDGVAEISGYYEMEGMKLKIRPDWLTKSNKIVDLKTSRNASLDSFGRDFKWNFNYDLSAAMYMDGMKRITGEDFEYYFIVVEKEPPFSTAVYSLSTKSFDMGMSKYLEAIAKIALCRDTKTYRLQNRIQEI